MVKILVESKISLVNQSSFERDDASLISATTVSMVNNFRHHVTQMKKNNYLQLQNEIKHRKSVSKGRRSRQYAERNKKMLILIFQSETSPMFCTRKSVKLGQISKVET